MACASWISSSETVTRQARTPVPVTEIAFCNLAGKPLEQGLAQLLEQLYANGERALVLAATAERVEALNMALWTYRPDSFLPHGAASDGAPAEQPIWLAHGDENPNGATTLVLIEGREAALLSTFRTCYHVFDRDDDGQREEARGRWRRYRDAGHDLAYWEQSAVGWRRQA
jgi:DNA polymerase III subunit chi